MWASELDEAALWDDFVTGLRLVPIKRRVSLPVLSVRPAAAAKTSSEGWRLCLRPNNIHKLMELLMQHPIPDLCMHFSVLT
jgi:hypothetical protein